MGIDADSCRDREIARGLLALKVFVLDATERNAANSAVHGGARGRARAKRKSEIVGESVGGAERKNRESYRRAGQPLNNVVNGAVAAAGEDRVAACGDRVTRVDRGFLAGAAD